MIISREFHDTEDASGFFSGWNPEDGAYEIDSWGYDEAGGEATAGQVTSSGPTSPASRRTVPTG